MGNTFKGGKYKGYGRNGATTIALPFMTPEEVAFIAQYEEICARFGDDAGKAFLDESIKRAKEEHEEKPARKRRAST